MPSQRPRREFLTQSALAFLVSPAPLAAFATGQGATAADALRRTSLSKPGPMLPPSPAILTSVRGKPGDPDELAVLWTFVVNGDPAQVGVAAGDEHIAGGLISLHREFVLNVPAASMIHGFDVVDFSSSRVGDKYATSGFTRGQASRIDA